MWKYNYQVPEKRKIRYIVHADAKNEADDQYTIAHAFMMQKFDVVGVIGGHFDKANYNRFEEHHTADASYEEILKIVELMGLSGKFPIYCGANEAMPDEITPIITEAARFIVEEAMKEDP